jgi:hypothetical protein
LPQVSSYGVHSTALLKRSIGLIVQVVTTRVISQSATGVSIDKNLSEPYVSKMYSLLMIDDGKLAYYVCETHQYLSERIAEKDMDITDLFQETLELNKNSRPIIGNF